MHRKYQKAREDSEINSVCDSSMVEQLIIAQNAVINTKWALKTTELPKGSDLTETELYKKVDMIYSTRKHDKIQTDILQENKKYFNFEYFNGVQSLALDTLYNTRENSLIAAPTGTGKTELAILAILKEYQTYGRECFIVVLAPTKPLINSLEQTLKNRVGEILSIMQDTTDNERVARYDTNILITTPERYDILTMKGRVSPSLLIIDEIHILEESRGGVLESVIIRSKGVCGMRIVGISATVPNYRDVAEFISAKEEHSYYFNYLFKEIPIKYSVIGIKKGSKTVKRIKRAEKHSALDSDYSNKNNENISKARHLDENTKEDESACYNDSSYKYLNALHNTLMEISGNTLIFINNRKECILVAEYIRKNILKNTCKVLDLSTILNVVELSIPNVLMDKEQFICGIKEMLELLSYGIAVHHASISKEVRNAVELLFKKGLISIICCTSTLACGVNLPANNVIIYKTNKPVVGQAYTLAEIAQMSGRAGRKGHTASGSVVIITQEEDIAAYAKAITFQFPVESKSAENLTTRVLYEIAVKFNQENCQKDKTTPNTCTDVKEILPSNETDHIHSMCNNHICSSRKYIPVTTEYIISWVCMTYGYIRGVKHNETRKYYTHTNDLVKNILDQLFKWNMIECTYNIKPTALGNICYTFYLSPITVYHIQQVFMSIAEYKIDLDVGDILLLVSIADDYKDLERNTTEYSSIRYPIRHKSSHIHKIVHTVTDREINPAVSIIIQRYIDNCNENVFDSSSAKVLSTINRVLEGILSIGKIYLNRSIYSIIDLVKTINTREWKYSKSRNNLNVFLELNNYTLTITNPSKDKLFIEIVNEDKIIHRDIIRRRKYKYVIDQIHNSVLIRIESFTIFTNPFSLYITNPSLFTKYPNS
ncbi:activating signal cointegrator complex subunit 3 [Nematocida sp. AWRm78]|nr:activating signal cointegrator complex subunit 3 [Nematocida sp. AWRm79]KAI5182733.1 activating signal cointegrator complex subunit 3 [Nematocida sp. AWRm78]